ncbi:MAG: hypothetical protein ABIF77_13260 [bacterium]
MSWRTHLFRLRPWRGLLGIVVAGASLYLVHVWAQSAALTALGGLIFLLSLWPFYFPVHYRLDSSGVEINYGLWRRRWPWERFQAVIPLTESVVLSPFRQACRLERFRSVTLLCPGCVDPVQRALPDSLVRRDTRGGEG